MSKSINSPCTSGRTPEELVCPHLAEDKNSERCVNCRARLEYGVAEGILHKEVLEEKDEPVSINAREVPLKKKKQPKLCNDCGLNPVKSKGLCNACYGRVRYKRIHKKVRAYKRKILTVDKRKG